MSLEQLKAFLAKVQADTTLQEQLKAEGADPVAIAKNAGFSITTDDLAADRQNLSEDELESVAGGFRFDLTVGFGSKCDWPYCCGSNYAMPRG